ncbi:hypothetical protein [Nocardia sp. NPDC006630]|uniref:hypothetical protein n=1 Tax=Nocardia sp. NPDC006630 TaxID=3157181 RepID=UPI0033B157A4
MSAPYNDLVEVPVGTFQHYMKFIAENDLWDESRQALRDAGLKSVVLGGQHVQVIREFIAARGNELVNDPNHANALVLPECSILCPQPAVPVSPGPGDAGAPPAGDAGAGDAGHPQ